MMRPGLETPKSGTRRAVVTSAKRSVRGSPSGDPVWRSDRVAFVFLRFQISDFKFQIGNPSPDRSVVQRGGEQHSVDPRGL